MQVWRLANDLDLTGIDQTVLTSHIPGSPRRTRISDTTRVVCVGASLPEWLASRFLGVTWFLAMLRYLIVNRHSHDLVHIHYNHWIWCRILTLVASLMRLPVVVSLNTELWVGCSYRWLVAGAPFNLAQGIERWTIRVADRVIALTAIDARRCIEDLDLSPDRVVVIPDAIDASAFGKHVGEGTLSDFRRRFRLPPGRKIVTYVGRIRGEKGWRELPRIAKELSRSGAFLLICGDGPDRQKLERQLNDTCSADDWCITGFLDPEEIETAQKIADVLILPSTREAFGSVLLEAMASGLPAVAYAVGGIVEVAGAPNALRLVHTNDPSAFIAAILELLSDAQKRSALVEQGYKRVGDFSLQQATAKTLNCYLSVRRIEPAREIEMTLSREVDA